MSQLTSHTCGPNCIHPAQSKCPPNNDPQDTLPVSAIPVRAQVCLSFIGEGQKVGDSACETTIPVRVTKTPLVAPKWSAFACGKSAYTAIPVGASGVCYLAHLVPPSRVVSKVEMESLLDEPPKRKKRNIGKTEQWLGVLFAPLGVRDLQNEVKALRQAYEATENQTLKTVQAMRAETSQIRRVALDNRLGLDLLYASEGGLCRVLHKECCVYIPDASKSVDDLDRAIKKSNAELNKNNGIIPTSWQTDVDEFFESLGGWTKYIIFGLIALVLITVIGCSLIYCGCYCTPIVCDCFSKVMKKKAVKPPRVHPARKSEYIDETIV